MRKLVKKVAVAAKKSKGTVLKKKPGVAGKHTQKPTKKFTYPPWTTTNNLSEGDHKALKRFYELFNSGKIIQAFTFASDFETNVREAIPLEIWKQCGGSLTPEGEKELKKSEKNSGEVTSPTHDDSEEPPENVELKFNSDTELEQVVLTNSKSFFGEKALLFSDTREEKDERVPDKFLLDLSNPESPRIFLLEAILHDQNFGKCFVRITHFFALLRNRNHHDELVRGLCDVINSNKEQKKELQKRISKEVEISEFISSLIKSRPLVLLMTNGEKKDLALFTETYTETWGKMFKMLIVRKYSCNEQIDYQMNPAFADLRKGSANKPEIVRSTEEDHLNAASEISANIYKEIKVALLSTDSTVEFNVKKFYISLRKGKNLAFFLLRKKISLVVLNPEEDTRKQIKHHEIKSLPASVQKFWNGPSCTIVIESFGNLAEVINLLKKMIAKV